MRRDLGSYVAREDGQPLAPRVGHTPKRPPPRAPGSPGQAAQQLPTRPRGRRPAHHRDAEGGGGQRHLPPPTGWPGHSRFAPIRDSMRSRRLWRSRWTMKSSRERMRKDDTQLTMRRIPLAIESSRLPPSAGGRAALRGSAPPTPQCRGTAAWPQLCPTCPLSPG